MRLSELQKAFVGAALGGRPGALTVVGGGRLSPGQALEVYGRGYAARLTEALGETYEAVWSVLGDEGFFAVCRDFVAAQPSSFYNLSDYGETFGAFLARRPEAKELPFLPELCGFEWAFKELFHRRQHRSLPPRALAAAKPGTRLVFGGAVLLRSHRRAVCAVWRNRRSRRALPRAAWDRRERALLYKQEGEIFVKELGQEEFRVLERLRSGSSLAAALAAARLDPERTTGLFSLIAESGIVERME